MLILCNLWYKILQNIINSLIALKINGICYNAKIFTFFKQALMYSYTLTHLQLNYKLCKKITNRNEVKIVLWFKVTSMSSLTACPFSAVAAAAKSGFILLQNPHPGEEMDHTNQQCNTDVLHAVYFYDFLKCSNSYIAQL